MATSSDVAMSLTELARLDRAGPVILRTVSYNEKTHLLHLALLNPQLYNWLFVGKQRSHFLRPIRIEFHPAPACLYILTTYVA
jgi:hypothetical protein